ncbi:MAG: PKD domain-containing protein, partial [Chitinophagaceae bacterium]
SNGGARVYATYIGGAGNEQPHSLIVDPQGNLIVTGRSNSDNYPIVGAPLTAKGGYDIIVTKLNATGTAPLIGSVKVGGSANDGVNIKTGRGGKQSLEQNYGDDGRSEVIIDGAGNIYVASCTQSTDFPYTAGHFQPASGGNQDAIVLKFNSTLSSLQFASYLGGCGNDAAYVLALGPTGDIYVAGGTEKGACGTGGTDLPGTHAGTVGPANNGGVDGFVAQITNNGATCIRSAYIGTSGMDQVFGIQIDKNGFPYVMGQTTGNWTPLNATYVDAGAKQFIAKLRPDLSAYIYKTTFGTSSPSPNISPTAFLVDRCENVYVSGWGGSTTGGANDYVTVGTAGMRVTPDALKASTDGKDFYFFVMKRDAQGPNPLFASFFGQNGGFTDHVDGGTSRFDKNGVIYQGVCANCGGGVPFPTTPGSWAPSKPASAFCNLGMIKVAFNLAGVGSDVQSAINGVPKDTAGCVPLDVTFTDLVRNAKEYIWNFGDGSGDIGPLPAATGFTQTHTYNAVGIYQVMLVAIDPTSCNLRDTSYIHIKVGDIKANLAADYIKVGPCTSLTYQFNNNSTSVKAFTDTSFIWDFGDGSPRVVAGMTSVSHNYTSPGTYNVHLVLNDTSYCNNPDSLTIVLRAAANVKAQFETPPTGCAPYDAFFNNTSIGGVTFEWDFGDPASGADNTSTDINPRHTYALIGTYTIVMVANDPFTCNKTDTTRFTIVVLDKPTSLFSFTPVTPIENTPDVFTNQASANSIRFKWLFGDGDSLVTTSRADVTHQYNSTGTFNACLIAYNQAGCTDTFCLPVTTIVSPLLDVPNAFTPNSNDVNSVVMVRGFGIAKMRFIIWNRWGQKVFETGNRLEGWDGKVKGVVQPMDVYAYTLDVEFFDGRKVTKKGDITLIR